MIASCRGDHRISGRDFDGRAQNPYTKTAVIPEQQKQQACGVIWVCVGSTHEIRSNLLHMYMDFCKFAYSVTLFYSIVHSSESDNLSFYSAHDFSCVRYSTRARGNPDDAMFKMELNTRSMDYFLRNSAVQPV